MEKKLAIVLISLLVVAGMSIASCVLMYFHTISVTATIEEPIPREELIVVTEGLNPSLDFTDVEFTFNRETGVEQTLNFYIKNVHDKDLYIWWRINSSAPDYERWDNYGQYQGAYEHLYPVPSLENAWHVKIFWNYETGDLLYDEYGAQRILPSGETQKLTLYVKCPYETVATLEFIIDIVVQEFS